MPGRCHVAKIAQENVRRARAGAGPRWCLGRPDKVFEVAFTDEDGEQRLELTAALSVPFESCRPVREFASYRGQRHLSGRW